MLEHNSFISGVGLHHIHVPFVSDTKIIHQDPSTCLITQNASYPFEGGDENKICAKLMLSSILLYSNMTPKCFLSFHLCITNEPHRENPRFFLMRKERHRQLCAGYWSERLPCDATQSFLPIVSISYYKPQLCLVRYNQLFAYEQTKGVLLHRLIRVNIFSLPRQY